MGITVYSKKGCAPCVKLKYWLEKVKQLPYKEEPIDNHIGKLVGLGFMSAPVVAIDDRYFNGSDLATLGEYINGRI